MRWVVLASGALWVAVGLTYWSGRWDVTLVFLAMFALDFVWAKYTAALNARRAALASGYSAGIILLSGAGAIAYVGDHWMLLPAMLGAAAGTYAGVER